MSLSKKLYKFLDMLEELAPEVVLVYGGMPDSIFAKVKDRAKFVHYPDWTSIQKRRSA